MAIAASTVWRVRPGGNNNNGGGYDGTSYPGGTDYSQQDAPVYSSSTTLSTTGTAVLTDSASGFTAAMVGNAIQIIGGTNFTAGIYFIASYQSASRVTLDSQPTSTDAAPSAFTASNLSASTTGGSLATGTCYVKITYVNAVGETTGTGASIAVTGPTGSVTVTLPASGIGADVTGWNIYSASASGSEKLNNTGGATPIATTTYTIAALGAGATVPATNTAYQSGSAGTGNVGGGWADFWTNTASSKGTLVAGNIVYVLGTGIPNPASYSYDYTMTTAVPLSAVSQIAFIGDPATPSYDGTINGGMPAIKLSYLANGSGSITVFRHLWFVHSGADAWSLSYADRSYSFYRCVYDLVGWRSTATNGFFVGCEIFSSLTVTSDTYFQGDQYGDVSFYDCYIHDIYSLLLSGYMQNCLVRNVGTISMLQYNINKVRITGCTIDNSSADCLHLITAQLPMTVIYNNIFSNCKGTYAINVTDGVKPISTNIALFIDYNVFYNNSQDVNGIGYGAHDRSTNSGAPNVVSANPFTDQPNGDYTLTSTYIDTGFPQNAFPNR